MSRSPGQIVVVLALSVASLLSAAGEAWSGRGTKRKVDPLELARVLLRDEHPDRALAVLAEAEAAVDDREDFDLAEARLLRGLAQHGLGRHAEAAASFREAIHLGKVGAEHWLALADAELLAGEFRACLETLERAPRAGLDERRVIRLRALAHYRLGARTLALEAVEEGLGRFGSNPELERVRIRVFLEFGLFHLVVSHAAALMVAESVPPKDVIALAGALAGRKQEERAIELLEVAALRFPEDPTVRESLAKAYFGMGRPGTAAGILRPVAFEYPEVTLVAAELERSSGNIPRALRLNGLVPGAAEKVRQRLDLLVEQERYAEAVALDARLVRLGLLQDQRTVYALAYAHYVAGDRTRLEELLSMLTEPELFRRAVAIRRAIEACDRDLWQCP